MPIPIPSIQLSKASGVPFYRQVQDQLAELMRSGQLQPGDQLPSVRELAATLVVSVITTRRAYQELESAGLIVRLQGKGTFVAEHVRQGLSDRAEEEATTGLREAVERAQRLGLSYSTILSIVSNCLEDA